jgi:hypothetical protein
MKYICGNCCHCEKKGSLYFCFLEGMQHYLDSPYEKPCPLFDPWENPEFEPDKKEENNN